LFEDIALGIVVYGVLELVVVNVFRQLFRLRDSGGFVGRVQDEFRLR
jgi:hypothetical protein